MKRILCIAATMAICVLPSLAQQGGKSAGAHLAFGFGDDISNVGFGAKFRYGVTDPIRLEGAFTIFTPKALESWGDARATVSMWDFSVNAHYLYTMSEQLTLYPLAGLGMMGVRSKAEVPGWGSTSASASEFGLNIGGGVDYALTEQWALNGELKFRFGGDWGRTIIGLGATYSF